MTPELIWSAVLTFAISVAGWFMKGNADELKRLQILLNRTREEMAKEYVTKAEVHTDINRVITRIDNLDAKIERMLERLVK